MANRRDQHMPDEPQRGGSTDERMLDEDESMEPDDEFDDTDEDLDDEEEEGSF
jgi:hypothetical protein